MYSRYIYIRVFKKYKTNYTYIMKPIHVNVKDVIFLLILNMNDILGDYNSL